MPPLVSHLTLARSVAAAIDDPDTDRVVGAFLLGATTPDIRVLLRCDRQLTHFFDLDCYEPQDSVAGLFAAHPHLRDADALNAETRAWTAGYLTHLVMDETYITTVYRPFFGERSELGGTPHANLLDRVFQFEFDRQEREAQADLAAIRQDLAGTGGAIESGFLEREHLEQWREASIGVAENPADWSSFPRIASRHLRGAGYDTLEGQREIMARIPDLLDEVERTVPMARMRGFQEAATERCLTTVREYLGCQ